MNPHQLQDSDTRWGLAAFAALGLLILAFVRLLHPEWAGWFQKLFGTLNPYLLYSGLTALGLGVLWLLQTRFGFRILAGKETLAGLRQAALLALGMGALIILADLALRYPQGINMPFPQALLFYPAAGFAAEVIFHLTPLLLFLLALSPLAGRFDPGKLAWAAIAAAAALEPLFQALFSGEGFSPRNLYTLLHVFVFALLQLAVFKRFDFFSMFGLRLFYYAIWHILWGVIRLKVLF